MVIFRILGSFVKGIVASIIFRILGGIILFLILVSFALFEWVNISSSDKIHSVEAVEPSDVAIVFGAALQKDGTPSVWLKRRLDAAFDLYQEGKVKAILLTGDNGSKYHNEPQAMADYLAGRGINRNFLVRDFAGFDTFDSCARAKTIFGVNKAIAVTQDYHIGRAVFSCESQGIEMQGVGVSHADLPMFWYHQLREYLASDKAAIEVILRAKPKLGGDKIDTIEKILKG